MYLCHSPSKPKTSFQSGSYGRTLLRSEQTVTVPQLNPSNETALVGFSRRLGDLEIHVREEYLSPEHPEILYVSNIERDGRRIGILSDSEVGWHYDQIYLPKPAVGSLLMAEILPPEGGNTEFADMCAAWDALPDAIRNKLNGCLANQSYEAFNQVYSVPTNNKQKARSPDIHHPIVRTHPGYGQKGALFMPGYDNRNRRVGS